MTLRERIKYLCNNKGISVNQLEKDCHFGTGYISKLDKSTPNSEKLQRISNYLDVSLDYLMNGNNTTFSINAEKSLKTTTMIESKYDKSAIDALELYLQLDSDDQGEIRGEMKHMLKADKYVIKKESKQA